MKLVVVAFFVLISFAEAVFPAKLYDELVLIERAPSNVVGRRLSSVVRAPSAHMHDVIFAVRQNNLKKVSELLLDISDPSSDRYGNYLTREEVGALTSNPSGRDALLKYLRDFGVTVISETLYGEYIVARAPVSMWEGIFGTTFNMYVQHDHETGRELIVVRTEQYSLPRSLLEHVDAVFNTVQQAISPSISQLRKAKRTLSEATEETTTEGPEKVENTLTQKTRRALAADATKKRMKEQRIRPPLITAVTNPDVLARGYNIPSLEGNPLATQAVFESGNQSFSPVDLYAFQDMFGMPRQDVADDVNGHVHNSACAYKHGEYCGEANLDVEYIMAMCQGCPTTYWYSDTKGNSDFFLPWIVAVANMTNPPFVHGMSYSTPESTVSPRLIRSFDTEAQKLGLQGVTIVSSTGDDGAAGWPARVYGADACAYTPFFPASSPYVTSVGGSQVQ
jgi:tripeptidyl-peptidase-1